MDGSHDFGWSDGGGDEGRGEDDPEHAPLPPAYRSSQDGRGLRRLAASLRVASERLSAGDADGCRLLLAEAIRAAEEYAVFADVDEDELELSEHAARRLRDGLEP